MAYEVRAGQGSAFVNRNKTEDWHAPYQGEVMLPDGSIHYLDIKPAITKAGDPWFAIKIGKQKQPKQDSPYEQVKPPTTSPSFVSNDEDLPF